MKVTFDDRGLLVKELGTKYKYKLYMVQFIFVREHS